MPDLGRTLGKLHGIVRDFVADHLPLRSEPLHTNNHNRQMMIYYELFRQTAEAMLDDGGPVVAEEMMRAVIKEMHARYRAGDAARDRHAFRWERPRFDLLETGWFMEIYELGEITYEDTE